MSYTVKHTKRLEILPSIDEDEAEFFTNMASSAKNDTSDQISTSKDFSSDVILPDSLHFKSINQFDTELEDRLLLLFKKRAERHVKEIQGKRLSETFEFDENIPPITTSRFEQLFHPLTQPSTTEADDLNDDVFTEVDQSEIAVIINDNSEIDKNRFKDPNSFMNSIRLFINDLNEETSVIRGVVDENVIFNRRSHTEKSSLLSIGNGQITSF